MHSIHRQPVTARLLSLTAAIAVAGAVQATAPAGASAQTVSLRMHTHVPPVAGSFKNLKWWTEQVAKASNGRLKITLFGSMQLGGKAADIYGQTKDGIVDIGWTLPGYRPGLFPRTAVWELPFIGGPAQVTSPAVEEFAELWLKEEYSDVHPIVFHSPGNLVLHSKNKPLRRIEDLKNMKIRTPSRIASEDLKALGAVPVAIPGLKVTEALLRGVVEAAGIPWSIARAIRTIDAVKYHTEVDLNQPVLAMLMNKQSYQKLPADLKKVIDSQGGVELAKEFGRRWAKDDQPGIAKAKQLGHEIFTLTPAEEARWKKATASVTANWIKKMNAAGHPGQKLVDEAHRLMAKYRAMIKVSN